MFNRTLELTYIDFKNNILDNYNITYKHEYSLTDSIKYYRLYTFDGIDLIECSINSDDNPSEVAEYESNYKDYAVIIFKPKDSEGRDKVYSKMVHGKFKEFNFYFTTGDINSLVIKNSDYADITKIKVFPIDFTGVLTSGSAIITGLSDTSKLEIGVSVTGTGIPSNTTIQSIDNSSQITLTNNATISGSQTLTFSKTTFETSILFSPDWNYDIDGGGFTLLGNKPINDTFISCILAPSIPHIYGGHHEFIDGKKITQDWQEYSIETDPKYFVYNSLYPSASEILISVEHNQAEYLPIEIRLRIYI